VAARVPELAPIAKLAIELWGLQSG